MFLDAPAVLFAADAVSPDLVRAAEPRFRRSRSLSPVAREQVGARRRAVFLGRLVHPTAS